MEFCGGGELFDRIRLRKRYTEREAARVFRAMVSVVHYMNAKGLMHRDLKPENVFLTSKESNTDVRVGDLGQAVPIKPGENEAQQLCPVTGSEMVTALARNLIYLSRNI